MAGGWVTLADKYPANTLTNTFWWGVNQADKKMYMYLYKGGSSIYRKSNTAFTTNTWYLLTAVYSGSSQTLDLYVNGQLDNGALSGTPYTSLNLNTDEIALGSHTESTIYSLNGIYDDVRIYVRPLSASEVGEIYSYGAAPVAHWKFNESSGTSASDSSDNSNTVSINGAAWTSGYSGNALSFDGVNGYTSAGTTGFSAANGSITAWVKPSSTPASPQWMIMGSRDPNRIYLIRKATTGNFSAYFGSTSDQDSGDAIPSGSWSHIGATWNNGIYHMYINGDQVHTGSYTGLSSISACSSMGAYFSCDSIKNSFFPGVIDDVRIYDYFRTESQIEADMNVE